MCDLVGDKVVAGVDGREDIEADLECMELNRDRGDCAEELVLYGVGDGDGETGVGVGDNVRCESGGTPRVVANAFNWFTSTRSCWHSCDFSVYRVR